MLALAGWTTGASAQQSTALPRFHPSNAGDRFFGIQSPYAGGAQKLHVAATLDYAQTPLSLRDTAADSTTTLVSNQLIANLGAAFAIADTVQAAATFPMALSQTGSSAPAGLDLPEAQGTAVGDLRLSGRVTLFGEYDEGLQVGVGGYLWVPTGKKPSYMTDGKVRGMPALLFGGRSPSMVWAGSFGAELRRSGDVQNVHHGTLVRAGLGLGWLMGDKGELQLGPEVVGAASASDSQAGNTQLEALLGAKYRAIDDVELGLAAGPGLTGGAGTPAFRGVLSLAWTPRIVVMRDGDGDQISDTEDACPNLKGVRQDDPSKNGCPADSDGDRITDDVDACPKVPGLASADPTKHGCAPPPDQDSDGVVDGRDACPEVAGVPSADPALDGCPLDSDGDKIPDGKDACPKKPGPKNEDKAKNGCPGDTDGDGVTDDVDACPKKKGPALKDPKQNGCPQLAKLEGGEVKISETVLFERGGDHVDPKSGELLDAVASVLKDHPEVLVIEIQGHTDARGGKGANLWLSKKRALAVLAELTKRGIEKKRLIAKGYGSSRPIAKGNTEEAYAQNRRVQFVVVKMQKEGAK